MRPIVSDLRRFSRRFFKVSAVLAALVFCGAAGAAAGPAEDRLRSVIEDVPVKKIPGVILLVEGPDVSFHEARGFADRKTEAPMRADYALRAGSIAKTYVAALSIMAANEGLLELDATIDQYLDTDVLEKLPEGLRPTVRQLLNHTSGVPDYYGVRFYTTDWKKTEPLTTELVLHAIRGKSADIEPGEKFSYSNTNYHLVALILEQVHDAPLETLLKDRIFASLGLTRTYYNIAFPPGDEIHGYGSPLRPWVDTYEWRENSGPDGGVIATATDLASWARALFAPNGSFSSIGAEMARDPVAESERKRQGLGVEILKSRSGAKVFGHTGAVDGYLTAAFYVPDTDTVMVLHMNKSDSKTFSAVLGQVLKIILENSG